MTPDPACAVCGNRRARDSPKAASRSPARPEHPRDGRSPPVSPRRAGDRTARQRRRYHVDEDPLEGARPPRSRARPCRPCRRARLAAAASVQVARNAPARDGGLAGRRLGAPQGGAVRVSLPVPRRRSEYRPGMVDLESERLFRDDVRPGVLGRRRDSGVQLLPAPAVEARRRRRGGRGGSRAPRRPLDDGRLLAGRAPVLRACPRHEDGRPPRGARSLGLYRAGREGR